MDTLPPSRLPSVAGPGPPPGADQTLAPASVAPAEGPGVRLPRPLLEPGQTIGPYLVLRPLASGGMGAVYVAEHRELRRQVALKVMFPGDARRALRFAAEAQASAALRHPNIVAVHDSGSEGGRHYLAMDLVVGEALDRRIEKGGPLAPTQAALIGRDVARALAHAHARGILHRDLKPANIIIDGASGAPLLTDFGLAKVVEGSAALTRTGELLGTPAYMPPEQARGEQVGPRADVFSLGATLHHVLAGRPPFEGSSLAAVIAAVIACEPEPLTALRREVPADLDAIVGRCLAPTPEGRYASAEALAADLERFLRGEPVEAPPRAAPRGRRRARRAVAVVAASLLVGGAVLLATRAAPPDELPAPPPTPAPPTPAAPDEEEEEEGAAPTASAPPPAGPSWSQVAAVGTATPPGRWGHTLTYDPAHGRVLLFGGQDGRAHLDDLWAWDGRAWTPLALEGARPPGRYAHAAFYDRARDRLVVHGGATVGAAAGAGLLSDQWEWTGEAWRRPPAPRLAGHVAWHSITTAGDEIYMFGGRDREGRQRADLRRWNGHTWLPVQVPDGPQPPPRSQHAAGWDPVRKRLVLFAGYGVSGPLEDLWEWDGQAWTERTAPGPGAREAPLAFDGARLLLIGGASAGKRATAEDWGWSGREWTRSDAPLPGARSWPGAAWDEGRRTLVLFGGYSRKKPRADLWELARPR